MDERLEKIDYKAEFGFDKETGEKGVWLDLDSYDYLTQQAEKVPELELDRNDWKDEAGKWCRRFREVDEEYGETKEYLNFVTKENQRYKEALDFYADIKNWTESTVSNHFNAPDDPVLTKEPPAAIDDSGEKARQVLRGES